MSYGWARTEILGGLTNGCFLLSLCLYVILEAIPKFIEPERNVSTMFLSNFPKQWLVDGSSWLLLVVVCLSIRLEQSSLQVKIFLEDNVTSS